MTQSEEILLELKELKNLLQIDSILKKEIINLEEAAQLLGVSKSTVYKYLSSRKLPFFRPTGKIVFMKTEDLYAFITRNKYSSSKELVCSALSNAVKSKKIINESN